MDPADANLFPHPTGLENMTPLGAHLPPVSAPYIPPSASQSQTSADISPSARIWQGRLHVRGHRNDMTVHVAADAHTTPGRACVQDARGWPDDLHCDSSRIKTCAQVFADMDHMSAQWFVRLFAVTAMGNETPSAQMGQLAQVMIHRQLSFEIPCEAGTIFLWAMEMPRHGNSILGVFRPNLTMAAHTMSPHWINGATFVQHQQTAVGLQNMWPLADYLPPNAAAAVQTEGEIMVNQTGDGRVWEGMLYVRGHANDLELRCVAIPHAVAGRHEVRNTVSWPTTIVCDSARVKPCNAIFQFMDEESSQWYVRIVAVDENGVERMEQKLVQLVKVLAQRLLAFEIPCDESGGQRGTLYLWGMEMANVGHSMLGVFRPQFEGFENNGRE